jgi:hypothetical protein
LKTRIRNDGATLALFVSGIRLLVVDPVDLGFGLVSYREEPTPEKKGNIQDMA